MKDESAPLGEPFLSVVIPVFDEKESIPQLMEELRLVLPSIAGGYEIIFVDDGSRDGTLDVLKALTGVHIISFARNQGKSKALEAGFAASRGQIIVTLDGDLQDDPAEIPRFIDAVQSGYELVCGWKKERKDPFEKRFFSKIANGTARVLAGSKVHDMNCGFKAMTRGVAKELSLHGDMHRYIPALVSHMGFRVGEIVVNHRARKFGTSKYGISRLFSGFFDLLTLLFVRRFLDRPLHFFGFFGTILSGIGFVTLAYLSYLRIFLDETIGNRPLLFLGILLVVVGFQFLSLGLLGEVIIRNDGKKKSIPLRFER